MTTTPSTEQLAPGTGISVELAAGTVVAEVGYHDVALGAFVIRIPGLAGYHLAPRTSLVALLSAEQNRRHNFDTLGVGEFARGEWEADPEDVTPIVERAVETLYESLYGRRRAGQIWASSLDVARYVSELMPDVEVDTDQLADFIYCLDNLGLMPSEVAERVALVMLALDPAETLAGEMADA